MKTPGSTHVLIGALLVAIGLIVGLLVGRGEDPCRSPVTTEPAAKAPVYANQTLSVAIQPVEAAGRRYRNETVGLSIVPAPPEEDAPARLNPGP